MKRLCCIDAAALIPILIVQSPPVAHWIASVQHVAH
jgi:hypothetical protein